MNKWCRPENTNTTRVAFVTRPVFHHPSIQDRPVRLTSNFHSLLLGCSGAYIPLTTTSGHDFSLISTMVLHDDAFSAGSSMVLTLVLGKLLL